MNTASSDGAIRRQSGHYGRASMPGLFLALTREQADPEIDHRRDTNSAGANGSKPEMRKGNLSGGSGRLLRCTNSSSEKRARCYEPMTAGALTAPAQPKSRRDQLERFLPIFEEACCKEREPVNLNRYRPPHQIIDILQSFTKDFTSIACGQSDSRMSRNLTLGWTAPGRGRARPYRHERKALRRSNA